MQNNNINGILIIHRKYSQTYGYSNDSFQRMSKELFGIIVIDPLNLSKEAKEYLLKWKTQ